MRPIAIIDVDTTLANNDHRAVLLERVCTVCSRPMTGERNQEKWPICECGNTQYHAPQSAWDAFLSNDLMLQDTPQPHAVEVLEHMRIHHWWLVYMTGRNEKHREVTEKWLNTHMARRPQSEQVIMRPLEGQNIAASVMKEKMFLEFREKYNLELAPFTFFEDDRFVLGTWQKYGVVFLCPQAWAHMNPVVHSKHIEPVWNR